MSKKIAIGLGIIAAVMVIISTIGFYNMFFKDDFNITGEGIYAEYHPSKYLDRKWDLVSDSKNLAEFETSLRLKFVDGGTIDAAAWDYEKDEESIHIWARQFDTRKNLELEEKKFMTPFIWKTYTQLLYADVGIAGIRKISETDNPLSIYVDKDDMMVYIYYYNAEDVFGNEYYDDSNMAEDKKFLIDLTRDMLDL